MEGKDKQRADVGPYPYKPMVVCEGKRVGLGKRLGGAGYRALSGAPYKASPDHGGYSENKVWLVTPWEGDQKVRSWGNN